MMICIDHFSKIVQLVLLQESNAPTIANKFLSIVVSQYGLLDCIMSDHDFYFCSHFWDELVSLLDTALIFSLALCSRTNGIAELTNCTMEQLL